MCWDQFSIFLPNLIIASRKHFFSIRTICIVFILSFFPLLLSFITEYDTKDAPADEDAALDQLEVSLNPHDVLEFRRLAVAREAPTQAAGFSRSPVLLLLLFDSVLEVLLLL